jgi:hypothetical protein
MLKYQRGFGGVTMYMGIVLLVVLAGSAAYFKYSQDKLAEANQLVAAQTARANSAEANLEFMQESVRKQQNAIQELAKSSVQIRKEQEATIDIFAEHDLKALAERKPGLIERRVNTATERVFNELEEITDPLSYVSKPGGEFVKDEE